MGCAACTQEQWCSSEQTSHKSSISSNQTLVSSSKVNGKYLSVQSGAVIGLGGFGVVRSANKTGSEEQYALKSLSKFDLLQRKHGVSSVFHELQTQLYLKKENTSNQFICDIHYAFQDDRFLYVLTDLCLGGDMRLNLNNALLHRYTEEHSKFYLSQVILAISACHKASILHRDCKPENIVLCSNGYIKLTDFGVAKYLKDIENCRSTSGTHGYLAPEVYTPPHTHGRTADWFAMGVTLHEFVTGKRPFAITQLTAFKDSRHIGLLETPILNHALNLSAQCKLFVKKCLERSPENRMGSIHDIEDIMAHPWFEGFNWQSIMFQSALPPFFPGSFETIYNPEINCLESMDIIQHHLDSPCIPTKEQIKFSKFTYNIESKVDYDSMLKDTASTQFSDDADLAAQ